MTELEYAVEWLTKLPFTEQKRLTKKHYNEWVNSDHQILNLFRKEVIEPWFMNEFKVDEMTAFKQMDRHLGRKLTFEMFYKEVVKKQPEPASSVNTELEKQTEHDPIILEFQVGESATADFEENTWTFEMPEDFKVTAGRFAIIPLESFEKLQSSSPELLGKLKEANILELERERLEWSFKMFPDATAFSSMEKLIGEAKEVQEDISNGIREVEEYADCLMCLFDSAGRQENPISVEEIFEAFAKKLEKNKNRVWKKNPDNTYSHVKHP